jgi:DNA polymerase-1
MSLKSGDAAVTAVREILAGDCPVPAVEIDPGARAGGDANVLVVATPDDAVLVDLAGTPSVGSLIAASDKPLAADDAKRVHRALLGRCSRGPTRWACTRLSTQLLAAGRDLETDLDAVARRHGVAAPPPAEQGFGAMQARARSIAALVARMIPELHAAGMSAVSRIEAAAVSPVAEMEHRGMPFDADAWRELADRISEERDAMRAELLELFAPVRDADLFGGAVLNLDSDADVREALRALGHPVPDMRRATVAQLPEPVGPLLTRFRELTKLTSTYGETFLEHVGPDGRIHPTFEQIGASTGRMACHAPNLQAMVKDAPHRACFHTTGERRLVIADYSACELRILAEMSGDPVFAEAFARGDDLHARVASEIFAKPVSKTENADLRDRAKAINFGLAYGMGAGGLARQIGTDLEQAQALLERYFRTFPRIREFLDQNARVALSRGWATTMTGRRLTIEHGPGKASRAAAERVAKNMPIQGTSADIIKIALARLRRALAALHEAWIVNAVHDEIVVECDATQVEDAAEVVKQEMEAAGATVLHEIPLAADVEVGRIWGK